MHDEPPKLLTPLGGFFVEARPEAALAWLAGRTKGQTHSAYSIMGKEVY